MKAIGYIRRSKQAEDNTISLLEQERQIREYCAKLPATVAGMVCHNGVSGAKRERWIDINRAVVQAGAQHLVVYNLDRLSRDAAGLLENLRLLAAAGIQVHEVGSGAIDLLDPTKKLTVGVRGIMDEFYRDIIRQKTKDALGYRKREGKRYTNHAPFGMQFAADGMRESVNERQAVAMFKACKMQGFGVKRTRRFMLDHGYTGRCSHSTIYRLTKHLNKGA